MPTPLDMVNKMTGSEGAPEGASEVSSEPGQLQDTPEDASPSSGDTSQDSQDTQDTPEDASPSSGDTSEDTSEDPGDMFPRSYVEQLRKESANYRKQAESSSAAAEQLRNDLHIALVELDGRLAVPSDLPPLEGENALDRNAIAAAIDQLLEARPRLAARALGGDIGQGARGARGKTVDLIELMRNA